MTVKASVTDAESLSDKTPESLSGKGEVSPSKSGERTVEQVMAENERKAEEIGKLREELQELKESKQERLDELEEKARLSPAQKEEMLTLQQQIQAIDSDPRAKAWDARVERTSKKASREEADTLDLEYAMDWLEEKSEAEELDFDKFKKEIFAIVKDRWVGQRATKKAKLAYKEWKEKRAIAEKLAEKKKDGSQFAEVGGKTARPVSKKEILEDAAKTRNYSDLLRGIAAVQDEAITKR